MKRNYAEIAYLSHAKLDLSNLCSGVGVTQLCF